MRILWSLIKMSVLFKIVSVLIVWWNFCRPKALFLWIEWPWSCGLNDIDLVGWVALILRIDWRWFCDWMTLILWVEWRWFCGLIGVDFVDWLALILWIEWRCSCALSGVVVDCVALLQWLFRLPHASQNGNLTAGLPHDKAKSIHNMNKINALTGWNFNLTDARTKT